MQRREHCKLAGFADASREEGPVLPRQRRRYSLDELLAQSNPKAPRSKEEREWFDDKPAGAELI